MYALCDITAHNYICEYKTTKVYDSRIEYEKRLQEYEKNGETSATISHKVGRTTYLYDATRRFNQFGRYMNHSCQPNVRLHRPIFIRGKSRIWMYSISHIKEGDELMWDYGITAGEMPWLTTNGRSNICEHIYYVITIYYIKIKNHRLKRMKNNRQRNKRLFNVSCKELVHMNEIMKL